jgi:hypothetical protein
VPEAAEAAARATPSGPVFPAATDVAVPRSAPRIAARGDATSVGGPDDLVAVCEALRDEASMTFAGNAVEQARASAAHAQARQIALAATYVTTLAANGFAFRDYELGERRLVLDTSRNLVLGDGAELLVSSKDTPPGFALSPDGADRILTARTAGGVDLRLVFRPIGSQMRPSPCLWLGGGRVVKMEIEIIGSALVDPTGVVLARGDTGEYSDSSITAPVRTPSVTVRKPRLATGQDVPAATANALAALAPVAKPCYQQALLVRPALRGTLVLAIRVGAAGRVEAPHVEMSSLGDDGMAACVSERVGKASLQASLTGQRFSVPLQFGSAEE